MSNWSDWIDIELARSRRGPFNDLGIYQVRAVSPSGEPIPISRWASVDLSGTIYIGRSGYCCQQSKRNVANGIREFVQQQHSGGVTYAKADQILQQTPQFTRHRLQVRAMFLPDEDIDSAESNALREYFSIYAELPPCNSQSSNA